MVSEHVVGEGLGFDGRLYQQNDCINLALVYASFFDVLFWVKKVKYWSLSWLKVSYKVTANFKLTKGVVTLAKKKKKKPSVV